MNVRHDVPSLIENPSKTTRRIGMRLRARKSDVVLLMIAVMCICGFANWLKHQLGRTVPATQEAASASIVAGSSAPAVAPHQALSAATRSDSLSAPVANATVATAKSASAGSALLSQPRAVVAQLPGHCRFSVEEADDRHPWARWCGQIEQR